MSLSFFILALLPALLAPSLSYRALNAAYEWERRQIAIDNAAIRMGMADRALAKRLVAGNQALALLEQAHHAAHECLPAPPCVALDETLETEIRAQHLALQWEATTAWRASLATAEAGLVADGVDARIERTFAVPIRSVVCPICGLEVYWEKTASFHSVIRSAGPPDLRTDVTTDGQTLRSIAGCNYELAGGN